MDKVYKPEQSSDLKKEDTREYLSYDEIRDVFNRSIQEISEFFGVPAPDKESELLIINSEEEFEKIHGPRSGRWVSAFRRNNVIGIFAPEIFEEVTTHKYTPNGYRSIIKHEVCHIFFNEICKKSSPMWLNEGTSTYVSGQVDLLHFRPEKFVNFLENTQDIKMNLMYQESGNAIKLLIENFGKEKFMELLEANHNRDPKDYVALKNKFEEIYGFKLNYEEFNKLLN